MSNPNPLSQPDNTNPEISYDIQLNDPLKLTSTSLDHSLDNLMKLITDAVRRSFQLYHLRSNWADIEDIVQSIALLLIKDDSRILRSFEGRSSLETWLQKIANHETIRFYCRQRNLTDLESLSPDDQSYSPGQDDEVLLDEIVHKLPKGLQELLELIYQGFKTKDIAKQRGIRPDSISKNKHRLQVVPDPRVRDGQVIKQRAGRRLVSVTHRVVFGLAELVPLKQISTSLLERLNGTIRQHVVPLHRKTRSFAKCRTALDTQTQLFKSYYNLCRKHSTLNGKTPAQAAGLSDHCWTLRELLTFNAAITSKIP
jgi:RNA polymerase sigma factor (sigma-70 family)